MFIAVVATWNHAQPEPTALSVLAMLLPAVCTFCPWQITEPGVAPKISSGPHGADDGLMLGLQRLSWARMVAPWTATWAVTLAN